MIICIEQRVRCFEAASCGGHRPGCAVCSYVRLTLFAQTLRCVVRKYYCHVLMMRPRRPRSSAFDLFVQPIKIISDVTSGPKSEGTDMAEVGELGAEAGVYARVPREHQIGSADSGSGWCLGGR
eukprot:6832204-Pyramimonas_sp.AAC.2